MRHATNTAKKPRRQVRFPGIITDAETLGVNRVTLYRILTGQWQLKSLRARYDALKQQQRLESERETHGKK